uniref:Uncharacterized protein n=1 Tax=Clytia hemisphaerica TaxID=252671 RepID=A0A7M5UGZ1_9CNID
MIKQYKRGDQYSSGITSHRLFSPLTSLISKILSIHSLLHQTHCGVVFICHKKQVARRTIQSFFSNLVKKNVSNQRTLLVGFHGDTCGAIACRCTTFKGQEKEMCDQLQNQFGPMFHYCERFLRKVHLFRSEEDLQK